MAEEKSSKSFTDWTDIMCKAIAEGKTPEEIDYLLTDMPSLNDPDYKALNNGTMVNGSVEYIR